MRFYLDCQLSVWDKGPCSQTCGEGVQVWTRKILTEARYHGACGETRKVLQCSTQPCDEDCRWSQWQEETPCSSSCGGGVLTVSRTVLSNVSGHGQPCSGDNRRQRACNEVLCPGVLTTIVILTVLLILALVVIGLLCYKRKYSILSNQTVSFSMPNIVKVQK